MKRISRLARSVVIVLALAIFLPALPEYALAAPVGPAMPAATSEQSTVILTSASGCATETFSEFYQNAVGVHLFSIAQSLSWCWAKSATYPNGHVYNIGVSTKVWTNPATPWTYDGIVSNNSYWGPQRSFYSAEREYGFHYCILWLCPHRYPWIRQIGFINAAPPAVGYDCRYGDDTNNGYTCTYSSVAS